MSSLRFAKSVRVVASHAGGIEVGFSSRSHINVFCSCGKNLRVEKMNVPWLSHLVRKHFFTSCHGVRFNRQCYSTYKKRNPYEILGLKKGATQSEIKQAFYKMSKKFHPDVAGGDERSLRRFLEVQEAYDCIRDEKKSQPRNSASNRRLPKEVRRASHAESFMTKAGLFYDPWKEDALENTVHRKNVLIAALVLSFILVNVVFARSFSSRKVPPKTNAQNSSIVYDKNL
uniref:J domain-containing protein n=1 Tax=Ditylenchus dipsaci TaxID=166011 RepID=A0A915E2X7_9BILA